MKRLLIPMLTVFLMGCAPSKINSVTFPTPFEFEQIDTVSGVDKDALYVRARAWMARTYNSSRSVVQMEDKTAGKIIGKAATTWPVTSLPGIVLCDAPIWYTLAIDLKDGRYRCVLSDFRHEGCRYAKGVSPSGGKLDKKEPVATLMGLTTGQWKSIKSKAMLDAQNTLASLRAAMHEEAKSKKDDW